MPRDMAGRLSNCISNPIGDNLLTLSCAYENAKGYAERNRVYPVFGEGPRKALLSIAELGGMAAALVYPTVILHSGDSVSPELRTGLDCGGRESWFEILPRNEFSNRIGRGLRCAVGQFSFTIETMKEPNGDIRESLSKMPDLFFCKSSRALAEYISALWAYSAKIGKYSLESSGVFDALNITAADRYISSIVEYSIETATNELRRIENNGIVISFENQSGEV